MDVERNWKDVLGLSASFWTIMQMLSPVPTCYRFIKMRSVGDMIVTPYVVAFMSCSLWLIYGILIEDSALLRVNLLGAALQLSYTLCYYTCTPRKEPVRRQMAFALLVVLSTLSYALFETRQDILLSVMGVLCCSVTIAFFASPLGNLRDVIRKWNSESLPRLLIAATFIVSVHWVVYGYMIDNMYVLLTNVLGMLLSCVQLTLLAMIPRASTAKLVPI